MKKFLAFYRCEWCTNVVSIAVGSAKTLHEIAEDYYQNESHVLHKCNQEEKRAGLAKFVGMREETS